MKEKNTFSSKQIKIFGDSSETVWIYKPENFGVNMNLKIFPNFPQTQFKIINELSLWYKSDKMISVCSHFNFAIPRILKLK